MGAVQSAVSFMTNWCTLWRVAPSWITAAATMRMKLSNRGDRGSWPGWPGLVTSRLPAYPKRSPPGSRAPDRDDSTGSTP